MRIISGTFKKYRELVFICPRQKGARNGRSVFFPNSPLDIQHISTNLSSVDAPPKLIRLFSSVSCVQEEEEEEEEEEEKERK